MKNNKKGFTLIELLAVIVILAIIALIATPIVLQIIAKARKSAAQDSLYGVMSAAKTTYMSSLLDTTPIDLPMTVTCDGKSCYYAITDEGAANEERSNIEFSGTIPTSGSFTVDNEGRIQATTAPIVVNGFKCTIDAKEAVSCVD